jgi:hypothetical protein
MSKIEVDAIEPQSGTTLTLGASGDTVTIPSGATLSSTDPLVFPAGTVSLPSITTTGDTNTGIFFPAADTIAFTEGGAEAMRINSSGNVGIGTSSPQAGYKLHVNGAIQAENESFSAGREDASKPSFNFHDDTDTGIFNINPNILGFSTSGSERMRITSGGTVGIGGTPTTCMLYVTNPNNVSGTFNTILLLGSNANNTSSYHLICATGGADKLYIYGNGNVQNINNSYGALSDIKIKQDIIDASSQWNDIKNVRVRKFRYKNDPTGFLHIGVVAQELEQVSPNLIDEHQDSEKVEVPVLDDNGNPVLNEDGTPQVKEERIPLDTTTKSVKYSILYMKAIKALQEAMERIETLEDKNTELEARITALENK